jgi:hypothetical protein
LVSSVSPGTSKDTGLNYEYYPWIILFNMMYSYL